MKHLSRAASGIDEQSGAKNPATLLGSGAWVRTTRRSGGACLYRAGRRGGRAAAAEMNVRQATAGLAAVGGTQRGHGAEVGYWAVVPA
jgi:hypothetical protein